VSKVPPQKLGWQIADATSCEVFLTLRGDRTAAEGENVAKAARRGHFGSMQKYVCFLEKIMYNVNTD